MIVNYPAANNVHNHDKGFQDRAARRTNYPSNPTSHLVIRVRIIGRGTPDRFCSHDHPPANYFRGCPILDGNSSRTGVASQLQTGVGVEPWCARHGGCAYTWRWNYALDNFSYFAGPVAVGDAGRRRRLVDSPVACGCGDSVDLQLAERSPEGRVKRNASAPLLNEELMWK